MKDARARAMDRIGTFRRYGLEALARDYVELLHAIERRIEVLEISRRAAA